ncbi:MAG TPA: pantoate--beta-alanine ligase [Nocardioides sp.]|uniref:pantoate--beta-alanine ligase n=1 Tax=Nocardioides sp. TaxID=35761 RepID=UPI002D7ED904|nr:pantoate--beta-alanine ligase [Nocardioides sp.]HET6652787.1 pantoate--beta-alanine ligase [Nocardioides sp.]
MTAASTPVVAGTRRELHDLLGKRDEGARVGLVPTMGALHAGHAALMADARRRLTPADRLVTSIFVNPLQFAPGEDLDRYPRTFDADLRTCAEQGVDIVFAPSVEEVYPGGDPLVTVSPGRLGDVLEGAVRPTHFRGVLTVVAKLFGLVRPDVAVFGEKDYQQLVLIRRMAIDLCLGVEVVGVPTVREADGLALSSRNAYLDPEARVAAHALSTSLRAAVEDAALGRTRALAAARAVLKECAGVLVDYLEITDPDLGEAPTSGEARVLVAARVGTTRLIDNMPLMLGTEKDPGGS